jgi:hypothetical protein
MYIYIYVFQSCGPHSHSSPTRCCLYRCIYIYIYIHIYVYIYIYKQVYVYIYVYIYIQTSIYIYMYICIYIYILVCIDILTYLCVYYKCRYMYICIYIYMYFNPVVPIVIHPLPDAVYTGIHMCNVTIAWSTKEKSKKFT